MFTVEITPAIFDTLCRTVGTLPPESGAILGGSVDGRCIDRVWFDAPAGVGKSVYIPSQGPLLSAVQAWERENRCCIGVVHSHSERHPMLSPVDLESGRKILLANRMDFFYMGLFCAESFCLFRLSLGKSGHPLLIRVPFTIQ